MSGKNEIRTCSGTSDQQSFYSVDTMIFGHHGKQQKVNHINKRYGAKAKTSPLYNQVLIVLCNKIPPVCTLQQMKVRHELEGNLLITMESVALVLQALADR